MISDPTYNREEISKNLEWELAFVLSEIINDNAPIGWSRYISVAHSLITTFHIVSRKRPDLFWSMYEALAALHHEFDQLYDGPEHPLNCIADQMENIRQVLAKVK